MTMRAPTCTHQGDLAAYDPEKGLKTIVAAEAVEKHFARALRNEPDDPLARAQYLEAIEIKIRAQADYVVFRDGVVVPSQKKGGTGSNQHRAVARISGLKSELPSADPGDVKAHRWRKRLCIKADDRTEPDEARIRAVIEEEQQIGLSRVRNGQDRPRYGRHGRE